MWLPCPKFRHGNLAWSTGVSLSHERCRGPKVVCRFPAAESVPRHLGLRGTQHRLLGMRHQPSSEPQGTRRPNQVRASVHIIAGYEPTGRLGDRAGQRRIDRKRLRQIVNGDPVLNSHRDRQYQFRSDRRDHHATD